MTGGSEKLIARREGAVGWLTLNNPARLNALSLDMYEALGRRVDADPGEVPVRLRDGGSPHRLHRPPVAEEARGGLADAERRRDERAQHPADVDLGTPRRKPTGTPDDLAGRRPHLRVRHLEVHPEEPGQEHRAPRLVG